MLKWLALLGAVIAFGAMAACTSDERAAARSGAAWDFDGDGHPEVVAPSSGRSWSVFAGTEDGPSKRPAMRIDTETQGMPNGLKGFGDRAVSGDLDDDGYDDLVLCGAGSARVDQPLLLLGGPDGLIEAAPLESARPAGCRDLTAADVDDDGRDDLIVTGSKAVGWIRGEQDAETPSEWRFQVLHRYEGSGLEPRDLVAFFSPSVGDVNGDGHPELMYWESLTATVYLHPGRRNGFAPARQLCCSYPFIDPVGDSSPWNVSDTALDDVDGDGFDDLVASDQYEVLVWYGSKDVLDTAPTEPQKIDPEALGLRPSWDNEAPLHGVTTADLNGDQASDMVLTFGEDGTQATGRVVVVPSGREGPQPSNAYALHNEEPLLRTRSDARPRKQVDIRDLDGDGRSEFVVTGSWYGELTAYAVDRSQRYPVSGRIDDSGSRPAPAERAAKAWDFNGDGHRDLTIEVPRFGGDDGAVAVFYGGADGPAIEEHQRLDLGQQWSPESPKRSQNFGVAMTSGDFDSDGYADLATCAQDRDAGDYANGLLLVLFGDEVGLTTSVAVPHANVCDRSPIDEPAMTAADFDRDGYADLATAGELDQAWARGGPDVRYRDGWRFRPLANGPSAKIGEPYETGDVNGDDYLDLAGRPGFPKLLTGGPDGFTTSESYDPDHGQVAALGDVNGDGFDDLALGSDLNWELRVELWYGSDDGIDFDQKPDLLTGGALGLDRLPPPSPDTDNWPLRIDIDDADGDGYDDLALGRPAQPLGDANASGVVVRVPGSRNGLDSSASSILHQDTPGMPGNAEAGDEFGAHVEYRDLADDPGAELIITAPGENDDEGKVQVIGSEHSWHFRPADANLGSGNVRFGGDTMVAD